MADLTNIDNVDDELINFINLAKDVLGDAPAAHAAVADLNQTISGTYSQSEVQAISDKVDALLAALRTIGLIAT